MSLIYLGGAWIAGIVLGSKFNIPLALIFVGIVPLLAIFLNRRYLKPAVLVCLCLAAFFGGAYRYQASLPPDDSSHLRYYNDRYAVEIKGLISRDPDIRDNYARLHLEVSEINLDGEWHELSGTALVFVPRYSGYSYGDLLLVKGEPVTPPQLDDFDYEYYLAVKGVYSTIYYPEIEVLDTGKGSKPLEWIYSLRNNISETISKTLPEPQTSLTRGIVLGMRGDIPQETREDFNLTGTAHLLAISGLHLSIVAGILIALGIRLFGRKGYVYVWLAVVSVWIYAVLTGMNPPVLRAAIMVTVYLAAELLGRQRSAITALVFAATVMAGITPRILWDASFQMSFMAMAGLVIVFPMIQALFRKIIYSRLEEGRALTSIAVLVADSLSVSLGAVIAVWPLIAYYFGTVSPVAPLATLFALPALAGAMVTGALSGIIGLVFLPGAQVIAWFSWLFGSYMLLVVKVFSFIPAIGTDSVSTVPVFLYYIVLAAVVWFVSRKRNPADLIIPAESLLSMIPKKWIIPPLLAVTVLVSVTSFTLPDSRLHVSFLDVGQGDAILIRQGSRQILVDGGPSPQAVSVALSKEMPFWDRTIDLVVMTHPDADHITGLLEVMQRYRVAQALYPVVESNSSLYQEFTVLLEEKNITGIPAEAGQRIDFNSGVTLDVLNPQVPVSDSESDDDNSVVLRLEMGEVSFLLTGDITQEAELELIRRRAGLESTVLKVAHHGSSSSTSEEFLNMVNPSVAVIQVGKDNRYGHPTDEVLKKLEIVVGSDNIYRTDSCGTVIFTTDGTGLWVDADTP